MGNGALPTARWPAKYISGLPEADVMPNAHDTAVQMIDTSIVRVPQHGACIARNRRQSVGRSRGGLTSKIHAVLNTDAHQSDLKPKSTQAGADGTQARARLSRLRHP
jgi:hypothetical protein